MQIIGFVTLAMLVGSGFLMRVAVLMNRFNVRASWEERCKYAGKVL